MRLILHSTELAEQMLLHVIPVRGYVQNVPKTK